MGFAIALLASAFTLALLGSAFALALLGPAFALAVLGSALDSHYGRSWRAKYLESSCVKFEL